MFILRRFSLTILSISVMMTPVSLNKPHKSLTFKLAHTNETDSSLQQIYYVSDSTKQLLEFLQDPIYGDYVSISTMESNEMNPERKLTPKAGVSINKYTDRNSLTKYYSIQVTSIDDSFVSLDNLFSHVKIDLMEAEEAELVLREIDEHYSGSLSLRFDPRTFTVVIKIARGETVCYYIEINK